MCGFAGFIDYRGQGDAGLVRSMAATLLHRGPDDEGVECFDHGGTTVGLGFRRLSIIDLSPAGHQPMVTADGFCQVMLNGEIYNYREIRALLEKEGCLFMSGSDTEVVLQAYLRWGIKAVDRFIGMFAVVIVDRKSDRAFLLRDRAGVKPLFFYEFPGGLLFASELKAFHVHPDFKKEIDTGSLKVYFQHGNIPAPYTIFKGASKVMPGSYVEVDLRSSDLKSFTYWDVLSFYNKAPSGISYGEAMEQTEKLMEDAFRLRMVADVPVGVFLSGGYDSTAVAALLSKQVSNLNTFTIGFEEAAYDESRHAAKVAAHLGTRHHTFTCTIREAMDILPVLPYIYDEPFGDSSAIPTTLVSRIARQHVTVALSADAGDELFAGYPRHRKASRMISRLQRLPLTLRRLLAAGIRSTTFNQSPISSADRKEKLRTLLLSGSVTGQFNIINQTYTPKESALLLRETAGDYPLVFDTDIAWNDRVEVMNRILAVEYKSYLVDDILQKVDRATMSVSLEGREPFLDHRLIEWVASLPVEYKYNNGVSKRILKDIVHGYVPESMMNRPKMGFGVPVQTWLKGELRPLFDEVMGEEAIRKQPWLEPASLLRLRRDYLEGRLEDFERIWFVFTFLQWAKRWM